MFLITQETNTYGAIVKSNRQFQRFWNLPKFTYSDSFSFLFSGHQQVAPQLGSCPVNVQYCNMTQELLRNHIHPGEMTDKKTDFQEILENVSETQELKFILRLSLRPVS